jgi:hypothetical protein
MVTFLRNAKGRPEALANKNDDVVMAAAIGYAILQEQGKWIDISSNIEGFNMSKAIFGEI